MKINYIILFLISAFIISNCSEKNEDLLMIDLKEHKNLALHIHPILEIEILGEKQIIPGNIGISDRGMRVIHTHKTDGILHIESPRPHQFYLADFFTIWGRNFDSSCVFNYCADEDHSLKVFVNDVENDQYGNIPLYDKDKIKIVYERRE